MFKLIKQAAELRSQQQHLLGLDDDYQDTYGNENFVARGKQDSHCSALDGSCRDPYASPAAGQYSMGRDEYKHGASGPGSPMGNDNSRRGVHNSESGHYQHQHTWGDSGEDERRVLSDRQLQEQLTRLLSGDDVQMPRDDPLVVLMLTGAVRANRRHAD